MTAKTTTAAKSTAAAKAGLTDPRVRILKVLAKGKALLRKQIGPAAEVDPSQVGNALGYTRPEINARPVHAENLLNKKYVRVDEHDEDGKTVERISITPAGRKALEAHLKAEAAATNGSAKKGAAKKGAAAKS